jgi:hypothetical protein
MRAYLFIIVLFTSSTFAQNIEHTDYHDHHHNEIGIANAVVYSLSEKSASYGLHFHYIRSISESRFGVGLGYERVFDEHKHNTFGLVVMYRPIERWSFSVSPGLTVEDRDTDARFSVHIETAYEFEFKDFHIGPVLAFAHDKEDVHFSTGLHIGYGF